MMEEIRREKSFGRERQVFISYEAHEDDEFAHAWRLTWRHVSGAWIAPDSILMGEK